MVMSLSFIWKKYGIFNYFALIELSCIKLLLPEAIFITNGNCDTKDNGMIAAREHNS